jgi:hypothetical protein
MHDPVVSSTWCANALAGSEEVKSHNNTLAFHAVPTSVTATQDVPVFLILCDMTPWQVAINYPFPLGLGTRGGGNIPLFQVWLVSSQ